MKVEIWFDRSNVAIVYDGVYAVYQKGDMLCIGYLDLNIGSNVVDKYPIQNIFKVRESGFVSSQPRGAKG